MYFFLLPFTWKLLGEFEDVFQFIASFFCNEIIAFLFIYKNCTYTMHISSD